MFLSRFVGWIKHYTYVDIVLMFSLVWAGLYRITSLNYNSAFNDEAIYIVVGRMGLFQADWLTYNAGGWMAGSQYVYPVLTALAYSIGGLSASRFLNVLFFGLLLWSGYMLMRALDPVRSIWITRVYVFLMISHGLGIYVSMLATYDMPSFAFFFLGITLFWAAFRHTDMFVVRRFLFLSALFFLLAVYAKLIVSLYIPLLFVWTILLAFHRGTDFLKAWVTYWFVLLMGGLMYYLISNLSGFESFSQNQIIRTKMDLWDLVLIYLGWTGWAWIIWIIGSWGMFLEKRFLSWGVLTLSSIWVCIPHFVLQRHPTFDKHSYLSVIFLLMVGSWGIVIFWNRYIKHLRFSRGLLGGVAVCIYLIYFFMNLRMGNTLLHQWRNSDATLSYLAEHVEQGDLILSEVGASTIMSVYDKTFPTNVSTFDWIDYQGEQGEHAYFRAVGDGHFAWIHLESNAHPKSEDKKIISNKIRERIGDNYLLAFEKDGFEVYKRIF